MATKTYVTPQNSLPLDLSDAAVKKLIRSATKRGFVTHDQINSVLPSEEVNSEQIEDVLADVVEPEVMESDERRQRNGRDKESTELELQNEGGEIVELKRPAPAKGKSSQVLAPARFWMKAMPRDRLRGWACRTRTQKRREKLSL
jgi:RNA polymerase primary sigma factor